MEIYILRHGIAEDAKAGQPDSGRALTPEGRDKLKRVLKRARAAGVVPSLILSSPYRRALETAEVAAKALGYGGAVAKTNTLVPDASPIDTWEEIRVHKDEQAILLASHEPLTSSLVAYLLDCSALQVEMKKGALARVDTDNFGQRPKGILKWLITAGIAD
jgi:phosphohistidine phosphatase